MTPAAWSCAAWLSFCFWMDWSTLSARLNGFDVTQSLNSSFQLNGIGAGMEFLAVDAAWPWLVEVTGGRQSARSIHFICAMLIALFIMVHLLMVALAGPFNEIRSMITGRFRLPPEREKRT